MTLPALTPEHVRNIRVWYGALLSGDYKELPPGNRAPFHEDGMCCAVGCAQSALGAIRNGIDDEAGDFSRPHLSSFIPNSIYQKVWDFFCGAGNHACGHSFADCAAYLRDLIFDGYHIDLAEPNTVPAPAQAATQAIERTHRV